MSALGRLPIWLSLATAAALSMGCVEVPGDGDPLDEGATCSTEEAWYASHCGETYCGPPELEVGTGVDEFIALTEGDEVPIMLGAQGGYHLDVSARMTRLCPVVYVRASVWLDPGDGSDLTEIADADRHVEATRMEPGGSSLQEVWGVRAFIPCEHWPDTNLACSGGAGRDGHLEDFEAVIRLEAEDHTGRIATHEQRVQPVCCEN